MDNFRPRQTFMLIVWMISLSAWTVIGEEPPVYFDNRPEKGIPFEAKAQEFQKGTPNEKTRVAKEFPVKFHTLISGTIKSVRIRYFNKDTWTSEKEARDYVAGFFKNNDSGSFDFQIWSQNVGVPEIECFIEFTDEYKKKLVSEKKECSDGRLLLWNTEACFRDATGRWHFLTAFDHFHRAHPKGDRKLSKIEK